MTCQEISVKQGVVLIAMYILGTTFLVSAGIEARQDIWIAFLLSLVAAFVLACINARIMSHLPEKDFFGILETLLGRPLSVVFFVILSLYLFQHYAYVIRHFSEYMNVAGLPGTPVLGSMISIGLLCALAVFFGLEVLSRLTEWFILMVAAFIIIATLLLVREMNLDNLRPVLEGGIGPIANGTWMLVSLPFGQLMAFLLILPPMKDRKKPYRIFTIGLLTGGVLIFISSITNVLVMGVETVARLYYPTYSTLAIIRIGDFIQRLEIVATTIFAIAVFFKATVLLLGLVKTIARILKLDTYGFLVFPVVLLAINYAFIGYKGNFEHQTGIIIFVPYFTTFHQIIIPVLIFALLEWKVSRYKKKQGQYQSLYSQ